MCVNELDAIRARCQRRAAQPISTGRSATMCPGVEIRPATKDHYHALARWHYRAAAPGIIVAIYAAWRSHSASWIADHVETRFRARRGHTFHERDDESPSRATSAPLGVIVVSMPTLNGALRDVATDGRYTDLSTRARATWINREVRTISRVVVDPTWRGLGVATGLVRHVLDHASTIYTEAWASMGQVSPFFERAGMTTFVAPPSSSQARLEAALHELDLTVHDLARPDLVLRRLHDAPARMRQWFDAELQRFVRFGRSWVRPSDDGEITHQTAEDRRRRWIAEAWRGASSRPVYYLARREPSQDIHTSIHTRDHGGGDDASLS